MKPPPVIQQPPWAGDSQSSVVPSGMHAPHAEGWEPVKQVGVDTHLRPDGASVHVNDGESLVVGTGLPSLVSTVPELGDSLVVGTGLPSLVSTVPEPGDSPVVGMPAQASLATLGAAHASDMLPPPWPLPLLPFPFPRPAPGPLALASPSPRPLPGRLPPFGAFGVAQPEMSGTEHSSEAAAGGPPSPPLVPRVGWPADPTLDVMLMGAPPPSAPSAVVSAGGADASIVTPAGGHPTSPAAHETGAPLGPTADDWHSIVSPPGTAML